MISSLLYTPTMLNSGTLPMNDLTLLFPVLPSSPNNAPPPNSPNGNFFVPGGVAGGRSGLEGGGEDGPYVPLGGVDGGDGGGGVYGDSGGGLGGVVVDGINGLFDGPFVLDSFNIPELMLDINPDGFGDLVDSKPDL